MKNIVFIFILSTKMLVAQNTFFITPYIGSSNMFCRNIVGVYGFEASNSNIAVISTLGINFEMQKQGYHTSYLAGVELDAIGYDSKTITSGPTPNGFFKNSLGISRNGGVAGSMVRVYALMKNPILKKYIPSNETKRFHVKTYLVTGFSVDWATDDYEQSPFIPNGVKDTITRSQEQLKRNISLWLGTHIAFHSKKRRLFELQITYKQGIQTLFTVARYNINTKEVYQILASRGSTLNVCLAFPIPSFRKRK